MAEVLVAVFIIAIILAIALAGLTSAHKKCPRSGVLQQHEVHRPIVARFCWGS
ncbi:MAG: hypothetical protein JNG88_18265 [Phycisphaerales bacterium]|nr:hypothetical protein [Phycisphaerales bacterium]